MILPEVLPVTIQTSNPKGAPKKIMKEETLNEINAIRLISHTQPSIPIQSSSTQMAMKENQYYQSSVEGEEGDQERM